MSSSVRLPYNFAWSQSHAHIAWADLNNNGVLIEIAVIALDEKNGDLYFIPIAALDSVDRDRLIRIITKRDASKYALWDLMSNSTLKNGENALVYFNQLVKVRSVSGQIFSPGAGKVGAAMGSLSNRPVQQAIQAQNAPQAQVAPSAFAQPQVAAQDAEQKRGPGRPPAVKKQ